MGAVRVVNLSLAIFASVLDLQVAIYFDSTIDQCDFTGPIECFCADTEEEFHKVFRAWGSYDCNNVFTRNPGHLIANATLTVACALLLLAYLVIFLWLVQSEAPYVF